MTRPKTALAIRHLWFEHLGSLGPALAAGGYAVAYRDAGVDDLGLRGGVPDMLIVLGGPIGACEEATYPFLRHELKLIERQMAAGQPLIGICLGAQLIARVLGADVYKAPAKEIGWSALTPTAAGRDSCLRPLAENDWRVLHWHGDTFDLPSGAVRLASTATTENQAFVYGANVLALQFHIEVLAAEIERWLIGHSVEIAAAPGVEVERLRADTARWAPTLERLAPACLERWLEAAPS